MKGCAFWHLRKHLSSIPESIDKIDVGIGEESGGIVTVMNG